MNRGDQKAQTDQTAQMNRANGTRQHARVHRDHPQMICVLGASLPSGPLSRVVHQSDHLQTVRASAPGELTHLARQHQPHLIVADEADLGKDPGLTVQQLCRQVPTARVVVVSSSIDVHDAVTLIQSGASDVILPDEAPRLSAILDEMQTARSRVHAAFAEIHTADPQMRAAMMQIAAFAPGSLPVLITGETGTGKDLMAHALHAASTRTGAFVAENVAGLDDTLFSDALFGHKRGAFTGAIDDRKGLVAAAAGGTLFLDEIGDLSLRSQIKLLRLIEHGQYYPLGGDRPARADVRFVLATNRDLHAMVAAGTFREDLYYRLAVHSVSLPPLRERPHDIPLLVNLFARRTAEELGKPVPTVPPESIELLQAEAFPGNVRELRARVINAVTLSPGSVLLPAWFSPASEVLFAMEGCPNLPTPREQLPEGCPQPRPTVFFPETLPTLSEVGMLLTDEALRRCGGNQSAAAELLGITPSAVNKRLRRHGVSVGS